MLGNERGKQLYHYVSDYVLFDLETTGISNTYDEVIEISAVKVRNGKIVDEFNELVNPGRSIPYAASMVNNITDAAPEIKLCMRCGMPMKKRNGKFGEFLGCSGYPNCKYTQNI